MQRFEDRGSETQSFENVPLVPDLSPFKPSLDISSSGLVGRGDKMLAKYIQWTEDILSSVTQNLIYQQRTLQDQDKVLHGLELRSQTGLCSGPFGHYSLTLKRRCLPGNPKSEAGEDL